MLGASKGQKNRGKKKRKVALKKNAPKTAPKTDHSHDERVSNSEEEILTEEIDDLGFEPSEFGLTHRQALFVYGCIKTKSRIGGYRFAGYSDNKKNCIC